MTKRTPNVFLIGAQKAGTTSLASALAQHPDVELSRPKEPAILTKRRAALADYDAAYQHVFGDRQVRYRVDASTVYSESGRFSGVAPLMHEIAPDAKVLYIVRNPIDRIESAWVQVRSQSSTYVSPDFSTAVLEESSLIDASQYWKQISEYRSVFPEEQILVLFFEDLVSQPDEVLARCGQFLDIDVQSHASQIPRENRRAEKRVEPELIQRLRSNELLRRAVYSFPPIRKLAALARDAVSTGPPTPFWSRAALEHVRREVESDLRSFFQAYGAGRTPWLLRPRAEHMQSFNVSRHAD